MDSDDLAPLSAKAAGPKALAKEDLAPFSVGDLTERIALLEAEIERCRDALKAREKSHAAAQAVFGKQPPKNTP